MTDGTPDLVQDVRERQESLSDTIDSLGKFRDSISEYREHIESMDANEQQAFYQSASQLRDQVEEAATPDDILSLEDNVEQAIRSPLEQVAKESLEELLNLINPDLSDDIRSQTFEKLESKLPADLDQVAAIYQEVYQIVDGFSKSLSEVLALQIEEVPSVLQTPEQDLKPTVESLESRYEKLSALETSFKQEADWLPAFEFADAERFYSNLETQVDESAIETNLAAVVDAVETLTENGIQVKKVITTRLESWYETGDLSQFLPTLRDIKDKSATVAGKYEHINDKISKFDTESGGIFEAQLDELHTSHTQLELHHYTSLEKLEESLDDVSEQIDNLTNAIHKRLKAQKDLIDQLDVPEKESPPQVHLGTEGSPLLPLHVSDNPGQALKNCDAYHGWITTHLAANTDAVDQEDMLDIWQSLSSGSEVRLTEDNQETILTLADRLSLSVVLSGT